MCETVLNYYWHLLIAEMHKACGAERRIGCFSGWSVEFRKDSTLWTRFGLVGAYSWTSAFCECKSLYDVENDVRRVGIVNWRQIRTDGREKLGRRWSFLVSGATEKKRGGEVCTKKLNPVI
jgi:hypothetical protein